LPAASPWLLALPVFLSTLILTGVAEEIGWRGFALPRLQTRFSALTASLILAALWAPWHYSKSDKDSGCAIRNRGFSRFLWVMRPTG